MRLILLALFLCTALPAADATLPPKAEQEYRVYLAALAKDYQKETAAFDAQLKREAAAAKKDPEALAAITALQEKVKAGKQLRDLQDLISEDLLGSDRINGGADNLIGKWNVINGGGYAWKEYSISFDSRGRAALVMIDEYTGKMGAPVVNRFERSMKWDVTEAAVTVDDGATAGTVSYHWDIKLPLPMTGGIPAMLTTKGPGGEHTERVVLERVQVAAK